jgi:hypothetical protein
MDSSEKKRRLMAIISELQEIYPELNRIVCSDIDNNYSRVDGRNG